LVTNSNIAKNIWYTLQFSNILLDTADLEINRRNIV